VAGKYGITYACSRPESPYLMMEYFTGELKAGGVDFKDDDLSVLTVISGAPDSSALNHNSVRLLEEFSGADIKVHSLDGLSGLENEVAALVGS
jgi:hypothetical protein